MHRWFAGLSLMLLSTIPASAEGIVRPAAERFADPQIQEVPDFQRHVVPLLGRLGCNGRACHGSFAGQGGFRLSLFGYDFAADHRSLTAMSGTGKRRVDAAAALDSLILQKPTLSVAHKGGKRFEKEDWQYHLLRRWIEGGARTTTGLRRLERLEVTPAEIVLGKTGDSVSLRVVACWVDGTREDVTCLCRFQSRDEAVAEIDAGGRVRVAGTGDTHVIAFYDNGVAPVPVYVPVAGTAEYPRVATPTRIDELVVARLRKLGIVPSAVCGDAEFLRRVSLDLTGTLPMPAEIEKFLADPAADKRQRKIDELLDSPAYAAWWANRLGDFTGNSRFGQGEGRIGQAHAVQWYSWLHRRLEENVPYDRIVAGLVLATGRREGQSYDDYAREMSSYYREREPADFTRRETLPHYWTRGNLSKPEDRALAFAHSFLGLRLQCAQCHKHPFDRWTQDDFQQVAAFFAPLRYGVAPASQDSYRRLAGSVGLNVRGTQGEPVTQELLALAEEGKTIPWRELYLDDRAIPRGERRLFGDVVPLDGAADPRRALLDWLRRPDNPYFARALVNRVWANYFHAGLIEPVDDLNLANPPSNRELLDYLAADFVQHGYDLKRLHRQIVASDTYQRSWVPTATSRHDRRNFSRAVPRRLPAEVVYDALAQATAADADLARVRHNLDRRAIGHLSTGLAGTYAMNVFGKPARAIACDCERSSTPSLLQTIFLQNDPLLQQRLDESGWLKEVTVQPPLSPPSQGGAGGGRQTAFDGAVMVRQAYLRTVSRPPTADEQARARRYLAEAESPEAGLRDLLWALLNSKEFILNH
jgi:hypothetical protein